MAKITLNDLGSGYGLDTTYNANNEAIEEAFEKTLSRDGTTPNHMLADLDMNSRRITNLPDADTGSEPVTKRQLDSAASATLTSYDAANGNYTAAGTGAVARAISGKLGDSLSVKDFGALGNGSTDDTDAIQAAIDAAISANKALYFPGGTYIVSKNTGLSGFPNSDQPCLLVTGASNFALLGYGAVLEVAEHAQGILEVQESSDVHIMGLTFKGPTDFPNLDGTTGQGEKGTPSAGYNTTNAGIWGFYKNNSVDTSANTGGGFSGAFPQYGGGTAASWGTWNGGYIGNVAFGLLIQKGCSRITVKDCKAYGFNYCGFSVGHLNDTAYAENTDIRFLDCVATGNQSAGINSLKVDGVLIKNCVLSDNGHPDWAYTDATAQAGYGYTARGVATHYSKNVIVEGCLIEGNDRKGLDAHSAYRVQFVNNTIRNCGISGISLPWTSATQPVVGALIRGNVIERCSYATGNIGAILAGGAIDGGYSYANSLCDLIIDGNVLQDNGGNDIEVKNGRNIQITNNIMRGFDDRASGSKYFMFLGRLSTNEPIYNANVSNNIMDADGDTSRYRGVTLRRARNSQFNHNMAYLDHASAGISFELYQCGTVQAFGNIVYHDAGATSSVPMNLLATDGMVVGNYSDPDVGTLSYPLGNEGTANEREKAFRVPHMIQLDITFNGTSSPAYTVNVGEDYIASVGNLATYGASITFQNLPATAVLRSSITNKSADGLESASGDITYIYERALSTSGMEIGLKTNASGTNITAANCTGGTISVMIMVF